MPTYLNIQIKDRIKQSITAEVTRKISKSKPGKELNKIRDRIEAKAHALVRKEIPDSALKVLKKYKADDTVQSFAYGIDNGEVIFDVWGTGIKRKNFRFKKAMRLCRQGMYGNPYNFRNIFSRNKPLQKDLILYYKVDEDIRCEIEETVNAYMSIVRPCKTVEQLLKKLPKIKKHIPKDINDRVESPPEPSRAKKIIEQFESQ